MSKYLIADFVTEFAPKYDNFKILSEPFRYYGARPADITLNVSEKYLENLNSRTIDDIGTLENFAYSCRFNKAIIKKNAMLIHSSAIIYQGRAYLFSAASGVGKSTHTRLWKQAFGDDVTYINDDKPVVRIKDGKCIVYGTPFDGGSGVTNNISAPLGGIIFLERGEENSIIKLKSSSDILKQLYFSTAHCVNRATADLMLDNFEALIHLADFYFFRCNMDICSAYVARDYLLNN